MKKGAPKEQICHSVFTLSSNAFCWFSWDSCSQTKLCCSFSCWSLAFLIWNCSSSFAALSLSIWKMQNKLVNAFTGAAYPHRRPGRLPGTGKATTHFFIFAEMVLAPQWKHKCTQIWWLLNGWGKWCLLMNNTESTIFFSGSLGKPCSQVVDKYFPLHHFSLNISIKASNSGSWRSKSPSFFCICSICWLIHAINCEGCYTWGSTRNKEHWNIEHLTCVSDKRLPDHREGLEGRIHRLTHNTAGIPSTEVNLKDLTPNSTNT